jgi:hypothetical protein
MSGMSLRAFKTAAALSVLVAGCGNTPLGIPDLRMKDFALEFPDICVLTPNACGVCNPGCVDLVLGPPDITFPLNGDPLPYPSIQSEQDGRVERDGNGYMRIIPGVDLSPNPGYQIILRGCGPEAGPIRHAQWRSFAWDIEVPANTEMGVTVLSGNTETPDLTWVFADSLTTSPYDLSAFHGDYLALQFILYTDDPKRTPLLKHLEVLFDCE